MESERESEAAGHCNQCNEAFIWTPEEAAAREYKQIGVSACGATAVLNILVSELCIYT